MSESGTEILQVVSTEERLKNLLTKIPQLDEDGKVNYLVTSGFAVELALGISREHEDVDVIALDSNTEQFKDYQDVDALTPDKSLADMKLSPDFLREHALEVKLAIEDGKTLPVWIVHPAVILVQKATEYLYEGEHFPRMPKDETEIRNIMNFWQSKDKVPNPESWVPVMKTALASLPEERRQPTWKKLVSIQKQVGIHRLLKPPLTLLPSRN